MVSSSKEVREVRININSQKHIIFLNLNTFVFKIKNHEYTLLKDSSLMVKCLGYEI